METLRTFEIAEACRGICDADIEIDRVCIDSRNIVKGCLFIAIEGDRFDGHDYVEQAVADGAAAVMAHKRTVCSSPVIQVENTRKALLDLASHYRKKFNIPVVGITGSVGKTTTKELTHLVLSQKYKTLKNEGNLNNEIGLPMTIFGLDKSYEAAVLEMGMSGFGEISALSNVCLPSLGIITNIGSSHIEHLGSKENILKAKLEILDGMDNMSPALLNGDDDLLKNYAQSDRKIYFFGVDNLKCDFVASEIETKNGTTSFTARYDGNVETITIPAIGKHNVYNALAAFAAGIILGVSPKLAAEGISQYMPSGMRQKVVEKDGITVIEDCYNASPDSMKAAINALASLNCAKKIAVLGDMLELGDYARSAHEDIGRYAAQNKIDAIYAYGDMAGAYVESAISSGISYAKLFNDKNELKDALLNDIKQGDAALFKASRGMRLEEVILSFYEGWSRK